MPDPGGDPGGDRAAPVAAKGHAKGDADQDAAAATTDAAMAALPGNALPTGVPPLPIVPDAPPPLAADAPQAARTVPVAMAADTQPGASRPAPPFLSVTTAGTPASADARPTPPGDPARPMIATPPDAAPEAKPTIDPRRLDTLYQAAADGPAATVAVPPSGATSAFRLVATPPTTATSDAVTPPPLPALPSGPLTVTQPGQAAATVGMLAGALRGLSASRTKDDEAIDGATPMTTTAIDPAALTSPDPTRPVVAANAADQAPLDMTQQHWPQGMIERIDRMREDAATADTRIQLSPDALGGIAVAIRHEDGATHLQFTAEQARTATMLADAHATLARLAEDRGMRLGDTAVATGAGTTGSDMGQSMRDQRPPAPPAPAFPIRPRGPDATLSGAAAAGPSAAAPTPTTRIA